MRIFRGFTLAETLIALGVMGVVAAIVIPSLGRVKPNQEMAMLRKAYYLTSRTVNELINDEDFYPDTDNPNTSGFSNTNPEHVARYHGRDYQGPGKFCGLFAARLNTRGAVNCDAATSFSYRQAPEGNFETADGIVWSVPVGNFASGTAPTGDGSNIAQEIVVDVNGRKRPNCFPGNRNCNNPDRYRMSVDRWGKIYVPDSTRVMLTASDMTKTYAQLTRN